jgi:Putative inner membrane protein (DUF1819)
MAASNLIGFRKGVTSVHTSRTMMLRELTLLLAHVSADPPASKYLDAIVDDNVLGKPTRSTRQRSAQRLKELYALDPNCTLFRLLRHFWAADSASQPMLAFLVACARDPLLRASTPFLFTVPLGHTVMPSAIAEHLHAHYPSRFRPSTLIATAQRLASSWSQAGYLQGKQTKRRVHPHITPIVTAFTLLLGYLCGLRGAQLLESAWIQLLDCPPAELAELTMEASTQEWLRYKASGAVVEITFPGLLTPAEE